MAETGYVSSFPVETKLHILLVGNSASFPGCDVINWKRKQKCGYHSRAVSKIDAACTSSPGENHTTNGSDPAASSSKSVDESGPETLGKRIGLRTRNLAKIQANSAKRCRKNSKPEKRRTTECLETIFEEPVSNKKGELLLTGRKCKRSITFSNDYSQEISKFKLKKRRERIKKKLGSSMKFIKKLNKIKSMNIVDIQCKLNLLDIDESLQ